MHGLIPVPKRLDGYGHLRRLFVRHLFLSLIILVPGTVVGQSAFSRITISGGADATIHSPRLLPDWKPGRGGHLSVSTPFYFGEAEAGAAFHRYDAQTTDVPRFDALMAFVGWGVRLAPAESFSWYNGMRVGSYRMAFDEETFPGIRNESELSIGLQTRIDVHLTPALNVYIAGRYNRTYTAPRLDLAYLSGGLAISLESPEWLVTLLR
ncbi:MAG: hypothetical protein WD021_01880 [Rhodothermales bacterium]